MHLSSCCGQSEPSNFGSNPEGRWKWSTWSGLERNPIRTGQSISYGPYGMDHIKSLFYSHLEHGEDVQVRRVVCGFLVYAKQIFFWWDLYWSNDILILLTPFPWKFYFFIYCIMIEFSGGVDYWIKCFCCYNEGFIGHVIGSEWNYLKWN